MRRSWEKMTRWAGIGHNGNDAVKGEQAMVDEMKSTLEQEPAEAGTERIEAGMEAAHPDASPEPVEQAPEPSELMQLRGERDQLIDRLARLQAEFDNARKRETRERADAREYTIGSTVEPFLSVMDNFQLALKAQGSVEQLRGGVELILKQMEEALRGLNVTPVETVGTQFDPRVHEALGSVETVEFPDHQVIEEIRRGYKIREKLLRPAMVKIAVNSAQVAD
jgi:molecular chaperone GrpE